MKKQLLTVAAMAALYSSAPAAILFSGNYFENFNSLQNSPNVDSNAGTAPTWTNDSTLAGWFGGGSATLASGYAVGNGSDNTMLSAGTVAVASFGSTGDSDRAFAPLKRNNSAFVAVQLTNNTGDTIDRLVISYKGEQWRDNAAQSAGSVGLNFTYQANASDITSGTWTSVSSLNFDAPKTSNSGTLNGNLAENSMMISSEITGLSIAPGDSVWLRWEQRNSGNNGSYVGIDDLAVAIPEPSTYAALLGALALGVVAYRRRRG